MQLGRHHRAGVQIHRVLGLVGQMRRAVLHLGDLGLGVALRNPIRVGKLLALALPLQTRQILGRGCLDAAFPGQALQHLPVAFAVGAPHDVPQRRVGLHGRGIDADALALDQPRLGDQHQNPVEDRRVDFMGQRVRLRDSQEWSGTRSRLPSRRNARSESESEQRHSRPRSLSMPSK